MCEGEAPHRPLKRQVTPPYAEHPDFIHYPHEKQITLGNVGQESQSKRIFGFDDLFLKHSTQTKVFHQTG